MNRQKARSNPMRLVHISGQHPGLTLARKVSSVSLGRWSRKQESFLVFLVAPSATLDLAVKSSIATLFVFGTNGFQALHFVVLFFLRVRIAGID